KFSFNPKAIPVKRQVSADFRDVRLGDLLESMLDPMGIGYEAAGKYVILKKAESPDRDDHGRKIKAYVLTVTGTVTTETGEPLPGVNVIEKGTTNGTTTDVNGRYSIMVPEGDVTLVFSFIGYVTQEVATRGRSSVDVVLTEDVQSLSEVVVVGYGTQKK